MRKYWAFLLLFLILSGIFYLMHLSWPGISFGTLMAGNGIMAVLSAATAFIVGRQLDKRPAAFVRGVYTGTFLKLLVCMGAVLAYVFINRDQLHKPSLFLLFGIYAAYTGVETVLLSRQARGVK